MIEKLIKNPLTLKRWRIFKSRKTSWVSLWFFLFFLLISLTAEFWSNSKPLILHYQGSLYFPVIKKYSPETFNLKDQHIVNYRQLEFKKGDWVVWPIVKWNPLESNLEVKKFPSPPSVTNWLGTDDRGRDVLSRLLYGYRYSIGFALCVWILSYFIGSLLGALMGYFGSITDIIGQRLVEIIDALPFLIILMALTTIVGRSFIFMIVFMAFFSWVSISLYMRAEFLRLRKRAFVEASRSLGRGHWGLIWKQIFPNALNPIITFSPFSLASFIGVLAVLDYLGFGLVPPTPSWGEMFSQAEKHVTTAWWLALFPSIALFSTLLSLTFIGNGMRDAFDPKEIA
ncbi:MAG: ABC transporter permease subunit [Bdellovibrionaceae bacterium]|nr:ABC transporter permease subunit [Pseudobdellovibrionaceae bacterium]